MINSEGDNRKSRAIRITAELLIVPVAGGAVPIKPPEIQTHQNVSPILPPGIAAVNRPDSVIHQSDPASSSSLAVNRFLHDPPPAQADAFGPLKQEFASPAATATNTPVSPIEGYQMREAAKPDTSPAQVVILPTDPQRRADIIGRVAEANGEKPGKVSTYIDANTLKMPQTDKTRLEKSRLESKASNGDIGINFSDVVDPKKDLTEEQNSAVNDALQALKDSGIDTTKIQLIKAEKTDGKKDDKPIITIVNSSGTPPADLSAMSGDLVVLIGSLGTFAASAYGLYKLRHPSQSENSRAKRQENIQNKNFQTVQVELAVPERTDVYEFANRILRDMLGSDTGGRNPTREESVGLAETIININRRGHGYFDVHNPGETLRVPFSVDMRRAEDLSMTPEELVLRDLTMVKQTFLFPASTMQAKGYSYRSLADFYALTEDEIIAENAKHGINLRDPNYRGAVWIRINSAHAPIFDPSTGAHVVEPTAPVPPPIFDKNGNPIIDVNVVGEGRTVPDTQPDPTSSGSSPPPPEPPPYEAYPQGYETYPGFTIPWDAPPPEPPSSASSPQTESTPPPEPPPYEAYPQGYDPYPGFTLPWEDPPAGNEPNTPKDGGGKADRGMILEGELYRMLQDEGFKGETAREHLRTMSPRDFQVEIMTAGLRHEYSTLTGTDNIRARVRFELSRVSKRDTGAVSPDQFKNALTSIEDRYWVASRNMLPGAVQPNPDDMPLNSLETFDWSGFTVEMALQVSSDSHNRVSSYALRSDPDELVGRALQATESVDEFARMIGGYGVKYVLDGIDNARLRYQQGHSTLQGAITDLASDLGIPLTTNKLYGVFNSLTDYVTATDEELLNSTGGHLLRVIGSLNNLTPLETGVVDVPPISYEFASNIPEVFGPIVSSDDIYIHTLYNAAYHHYHETNPQLLDHIDNEIYRAFSTSDAAERNRILNTEVLPALQESGAHGLYQAAMDVSFNILAPQAVENATHLGFLPREAFFVLYMQGAAVMRNPDNISLKPRDMLEHAYDSVILDFIVLSSYMHSVHLANPLYNPTAEFAPYIDALEPFLLEGVTRGDVETAIINNQTTSQPEVDAGRLIATLSNLIKNPSEMKPLHIDVEKKNMSDEYTLVSTTPGYAPRHDIKGRYQPAPGGTNHINALPNSSTTYPSSTPKVSEQVNPGSPAQAPGADLLNSPQTGTPIQPPIVDNGVHAESVAPARPDWADAGEMNVSAGMSLSDIAATWGVNISTLALFNIIADPNRIEAGQKISRPPTGWMAPDVKQLDLTPAAADGPSSASIGDAGTFMEFARLHGRSAEDIAAYNNLPNIPNLVHKGDIFMLPPDGWKAPAGNAPKWVPMPEAAPVVVPPVAPPVAPAPPPLPAEAPKVIQATVVPIAKTPLPTPVAAPVAKIETPAPIPAPTAVEVPQVLTVTSEDHTFTDVAKRNNMSALQLAEALGMTVPPNDIHVGQVFTLLPKAEWLPAGSAHYAQPVTTLYQAPVSQEAHATVAESQAQAQPAPAEAPAPISDVLPYADNSAAVNSLAHQTNPSPAEVDATLAYMNGEKHVPNDTSVVARAEGWLYENVTGPVIDGLKNTGKSPSKVPPGAPMPPPIPPVIPVG